MRLTLAQLGKMSFPYQCTEIMDLKEELVGFEDILGIAPIEISYEIFARGIDTYEIRFSFKASLTLECAVSLQAVPYTIEVSQAEIFTTDTTNEDAFVIDGITLDTKEAIIANILVNKPMRVVAEGVDFIEEADLEEEEVNPAFAKLKDFL